MELKALAIYGLYIWVAIFFVNNLAFKYIVLKRLKNHHQSVFEALGSPTIFSPKESLWALVGLSKEINIRQMLAVEHQSNETLSLLSKYRISVASEVIVLFIALGMLIWSK